MGEFLDRTRQHELLLELRDEYPHHKVFNLGSNEQGRRESVNLHYLLEHGVIEGQPRFSTTGDKSSIWRVRITSKGLDFLADDGGLGAILGVVTVKLHDETVRELLMAKLDADDTKDHSTKAKLKDKIKGLPAEALGVLVKKAMEAGLAHIGDIGAWMHQLGYVA